MPSLALAGSGSHGTMLAAAAGHLGWGPVTADADPATVVADVVVVDTPAGRRAGDAITLLARGAAVILAPGCGLAAMTAVADAAAGSTSPLAIGEPFPTAPGVQRWFRELRTLGAVDHLSGRAASAAPGARPADGVALDWPLLAALVLSARLAGWGDAVATAAAGGADVVRFASGAALRMTIEPPAPGRAPHWELQAASPTGALRLEMIPTPVLERDGGAVALPATPDPAERFGAAPLLRTFWADVSAGRRPVLDAAFGLSIERLRAELSRAR